MKKLLLIALIFIGCGQAKIKVIAVKADTALIESNGKLQKVAFDDTCDWCDMTNNNDPHKGNPYVYHDQEGHPICLVKFVTQ